MKKIRAAIVGYGNIGHFSLEALEAAPDFEIAGVVRRKGGSDKPRYSHEYPRLPQPTDAKQQENQHRKCYCSWLGPWFRLGCTCTYAGPCT